MRRPIVSLKLLLQKGAHYSVVAKRSAYVNACYTLKLDIWIQLSVVTFLGAKKPLRITFERLSVRLWPRLSRLRALNYSRATAFMFGFA